MINRLIALLLFTVSTCCATAQDNRIMDEGIASLQVTAGANWLSMPVIRLGGDSDSDIVNIGFDDLTHTYRRMTYTVVHCDADWSESEGLFSSDYIEGFTSGNTIDDYHESVNTNTQYTHYELQIPNERCRLKMSGNYKVNVFDEDDDNRLLFSACFYVLEPAVAVGLGVTTNTDIDVNQAHQQVSMKVDYGSLRVTDLGQIKTTVMQNRRTDNAVINPKPQSVTPNGQTWEHCRELIFKAGNEYHKFEILDVSHPSMGIERIDWDGNQYNAYPYPCEPRLNYVYDEDADGSFFIRNSDNSEVSYTSDYMLVHYTLKCDKPVNGTVYVNGAWTNNLFAPPYEMSYNANEGCYTAAIQQKLGYYSYQFILKDTVGQSVIMPTEGSFHQTENRYQALVYYRGQGERADRLVGYTEIQFK